MARGERQQSRFQDKGERAVLVDNNGGAHLKQFFEDGVPGPVIGLEFEKRPVDRLEFALGKDDVGGLEIEDIVVDLFQRIDLDVKKKFAGQVVLGGLQGDDKIDAQPGRDHGQENYDDEEELQEKLEQGFTECHRWNHTRKNGRQSQEDPEEGNRGWHG
jgi:hypothetical protein